MSLVDYARKRGAKCALCGAADFAEPNFMALPFSITGGKPSPTSAFLVAPLVCQDCGLVAFFDKNLVEMKI